MWEQFEQEIWMARDSHWVSAVCYTVLDTFCCILLSLFSNLWTGVIFPFTNDTGKINLSQVISGRARTGGNCQLKKDDVVTTDQPQTACKEPFLWRHELNIWVSERVISNWKLIPAWAKEMKSKGIISVGLSSPRKEEKSDLGRTKQAYFSAEFGGGGWAENYGMISWKINQSQASFSRNVLHGILRYRESW